MVHNCIVTTSNFDLTTTDAPLYQPDIYWRRQLFSIRLYSVDGTRTNVYEALVELHWQGKTEVLGKNLSHSPLVHHKSHTKWPASASGLPRCKAGDYSLEPWHYHRAETRRVEDIMQLCCKWHCGMTGSVTYKCLLAMQTAGLLEQIPFGLQQ